MRGVKRHEEVLDYIKKFNLYHMRMPAYKDMIGELKIGKGPLHRILKRLVEDKKLEKLPSSTLPYRIL